MKLQILLILLLNFAIGNSLYCYHCKEGEHCIKFNKKKVSTLSCNKTAAYRGIFPSDFFPSLTFPVIGNSTNGTLQCLSAGNSSVTNRLCIKTTELMTKRVCDAFLKSNGKFCKACGKDDCNGSNSLGSMSLYSLIFVPTFIINNVV